MERPFPVAFTPPTGEVEDERSSYLRTQPSSSRMSTERMGTMVNRRAKSTMRKKPWHAWAKLLCILLLCYPSCSAFIKQLPTNDRKTFQPHYRAAPTHRNHRLFSATSPNASSEEKSKTSAPSPKQRKARPHFKNGSKRHEKRPSSPEDKRVQQSKRVNQSIISCEDGMQVLQALQQFPGALTKQAGGGALNSINFSTALHRLARHSLHAPDRRAQILSDARLALLLASTAESMSLGHHDIKFSSRELSNIGWALVKLKVTPPTSAMPLIQGLTPEQEKEQLLTMATELRQAVVQAAKDRSVGEPQSPRTWVPLVSQLAGCIIDCIRSSIIRCKGRGFRQQEMSNLLWAFSTADRVDPHAFEVIVQCMVEQQDKLPTVECKPQEWSNAIWSFAKSQVYQGHEVLLDQIANLVQDEDFVENYKPQEYSNSMWATATILSNKPTPVTEQEGQAALIMFRKFAEAIVRRGTDGYKTQELANTIWAMATLGFGLKPSPDQALNNYVVLPSNQLERDVELREALMATIMESSRNLLHRFRSQELNNLAWSLARLRDELDPDTASLLECIGRQMCHPKRKVSSQDIGTTLWSFATIEYFDEDIFRRIASRLSPAMVQGCKPQEVSNICWAFATVEMDLLEGKDAFDTSLVPDVLRPGVNEPVTRCFAIAAEELMRRPQQFKPQEMKDILWSFSKVGVRHPRLFKSISEHLVGITDDPSSPARGFDEFSPQGIGNLAWAFARQAQLCDEVIDRFKGRANAFIGTGRMAVRTTSYFDIGENLLNRVFTAIAESSLRVHNDLSSFKPQDLSNSLWAYALLGLRHDRLADAAKRQLADRTNRNVCGERNSMTTFKGQEIANIVWSLATLDVPMNGVLDRVSAYLQAVLEDENGVVSTKTLAKFFKRQELANIAWSLAVFGQYPIPLINYVYTGMVGTGEREDPVYMSEVFGDLGLQSQTITTLIYVQAAMDRDDSIDVRMALPDGFPDGWQEHERTGDGTICITEPTFELSLSTSKIQRAVSDAFHRIGFDHSEEHIITMEDMALDYGINVSPKQKEILSIDIANVPQKIAVEVDGPAHFLANIDRSGPSDSSDHGFVTTNKGKLEYQYAWTGSMHTINGPTSLKQRLLHSLGWKVIHLPYWEWYALGGDPTKEEDYCMRVKDKIGLAEGM